VSFVEVLWTAFLIFIWFAWIWMVVSILMDIFRSDDLSGWGKAGWTLLVVFLTWIGVIAYLVARGEGMNQRRLADAARMQQMQADYIREVAGTSEGGGATSTADELAKLAELHQRGVLSDEEFAAQKSRLLV